MLATILMLTLASLQTPAKDTLSGAVNVTRVDATILCGGATSAEAYPELKKRGFASVINLRQPQEQGVDIPGAQAAAGAAGLKYIHIPVDGAKPDPKSADDFLAAVTDKGNQPAYIHCGSANRVGAMWMIKRLVVDGWDAARATEEAKAIGLRSETLRQFAIDYAAARKKQ